MSDRLSRRTKRRRFLKGSSQGRLVVRVYGLLLLALAVAAILVYLLANRRLEENYARAHLTIASTLEGLVPWIVAANLLGLVVVLLMILRFTLSVAGPEFRLCRVLEAVGRGEWVHPVRLRAGDQLAALATSVNQLTRSLSARFRDVHQAREELDRLSKQEGAPEQLSNVLQSLDAALEDMHFEDKDPS